jgi:fatty-acyl-CoA synthase
VAEAAVIAIAHPRWQERPLAVTVLKEEESATAEDLLSHLSKTFPKWSLPDAVEFVAEIPRTSTGKFKKLALREQFGDYALPDTEASRTT